MVARLRRAAEKALALVMAVVVAAGLVPLPSFAYEGDSSSAADALAAAPLAGAPSAATAKEKTKYRVMDGTVYFSFSHPAWSLASHYDSEAGGTGGMVVTEWLGKTFPESDGEVSGTTLWHVPVELSEVCKIDLDDEGLGDFKLPASDPDADYQYEVTALQLVVYMTKHYSSGSPVGYVDRGNGRGCELTSALGFPDVNSSFSASFGFHYLVNGKLTYPETALYGGRRMGGPVHTAVLQDGDSLDLTAFMKNRSFKHKQGVTEFVDADGNAVYEVSGREGKVLDLSLDITCTVATSEWAFGSVNEQAGLHPDTTTEDCGLGFPVYYGKHYGEAEGMVRTDESGRVRLVFDDPGEYYLWGDAERTHDGYGGVAGLIQYYFSQPYLDTTPAMCKVTIRNVHEAPVFSERDFPVAYQNEAYGAALPLDGWPVPTVELVGGSLPPGLSLTPANTLVGTPTARGDFSFTLRATNTSGSASRELSLSVRGRAPSAWASDVDVDARDLPTMSLGQPARFAVQTAGTPAPQVSVTGLPEGLSWSESERAIVGAPEESGIFVVTLRAANGVDADGLPDAGYSTGRSYRLDVNRSRAYVTTSLISPMSVGQFGTETLDAFGAAEGSWRLESGRLHEGLELSPDGVISGKPQEKGTLRFTVSVADEQGNRVSRELSLRCMTKHRSEKGTVYLSVSYAGEFTKSDGALAGVPMVHVPINFEAASLVDLDDYSNMEGESLGQYNYQRPDANDPDYDADYEYETTLMQVLLYASELYSAEGAEGLACSISGKPGSTWLGGGGLLGYESGGNLLYYVNGAFPYTMFPDGSSSFPVGSTSDRTLIHPGDFIDICMWPPGGTGDSSTFGGFTYFCEGDEPTSVPFTNGTGEVVHRYEVPVDPSVDGEFSVRVVRAGYDDQGMLTSLEPVVGKTVRMKYSMSSPRDGSYPEAMTDDEGIACFMLEAGAYYCRPGSTAYLTTDEDRDLPAYAQVDFTSDEPVEVDKSREAWGTGPTPTGFMEGFAHAVAGRAYSARVELASERADDVSFRLDDGCTMPAGLSFAEDGTVSGTPQEAGVFDITGTVGDSHGRSEFDAKLVVWAAPGWSFKTASLPDAAPGQRYLADLDVGTRGAVPPLDGGSDWGGATCERVACANDATWLDWYSDLGFAGGTAPASWARYQVAVRAWAGEGALANWEAGYREYLYAQWQHGALSQRAYDAEIAAIPSRAKAVETELRGLYDTGKVVFALNAVEEGTAASAKTAKSQLASYRAASAYASAQQTELKKAISAGNAAIDKAASKAAVASALKDAKAAIDKIKRKSSVSIAAWTTTYTGKKIAYKGTVKKSGSTGAVTYSYYSDKACKKSVKAANVKDAGTYYVKATVAAKGSYAAATSAAAKMTVKKAANGLTAKAAKSSFKVNKSKAQTTTVKVSKASGKVTYKSNKGKVKVTSKGKVTIAKGFKGKATITVKAVGDKNHVAATKKVTITVK